MTRVNPGKVAATEADLKRWMLHHRITVRKVNDYERLCIFEEGGTLAVNKYRYIAEQSNTDGFIAKSGLGSTPHNAITALGVQMWAKGGAVNLS